MEKFYKDVHNRSIDNDITYLLGSDKSILKVLVAINKYPGISGPMLREKIGLGKSSFYNIMGKIDKCNLVHIEKNGNTNYFVLSELGVRYIERVKGL